MRLYGQEYRIRATQFAPVDCVTLGDLLMTVHEDPELKFIIDAFGVRFWTEKSTMILLRCWLLSKLANGFL
jgi:hypothetical protein